MSRQQLRTVRKLVGIVVVLAVALAAVLIFKSRQAAQAEADAEAEAQASIITDQDSFTALTYDNGETTLSFHVDEESGEWVWSDDPEFPLNQTTVTSIANLLSTLTPQQTITDGDTLEAYGLDQPIATLTATDAEGKTLTLDLGNTTTDGQSYYMLMNGDESTVYIISGTLYQSYMTKSIYDMCQLPDLPYLSEEEIVSVTVTGSGSSVTLEAEAGEADEDGTVPVTWTRDGADVTGDETVQDLVSAVRSLFLEKCVDYKPTDEAVALCGLAEPAAELSMVYRTDSGAEQTLELELGGMTLDESGYYVRLPGDTTIYQLGADDVQAILAAAESAAAA